MKKTEFDRLMERYLLGQVTEDERVKIERWLDLVKTDNQSGLELSRDDEEKIFRQITAENNKDIVMPSRSSGSWIRIAASIAVALLTGYGAYLGLPGKRVADVSNKIILNDGTILWSRGESKVAFSQTEETRDLIFQGNALFEVAKDPSRPFVIHCGTSVIRVVGTSFNLFTNGDSLSIGVLTGKVRFIRDEKTVELQPTQQLSAGKRIEQNILDATELKTVIDGTEYNMEFANTALSDVLNRVGKKFNIRFAIDDPRTTRCRVTADFTDQSLATTLEMITEVLDVKYSRTGNVITIAGAGCPTP